MSFLGFFYKDGDYSQEAQADKGDDDVLIKEKIDGDGTLPIENVVNSGTGVIVEESCREDADEGCPEECMKGYFRKPKTDVDDAERGDWDKSQKEEVVNCMLAKPFT